MTSIAPSIAFHRPGKSSVFRAALRSIALPKMPSFDHPLLPLIGDGRMEGGLEGRPPSIAGLRSTPTIETDGSDGRLTVLDRPEQPPERLARRRQQLAWNVISGRARRALRPICWAGRSSVLR
jgi:hypothetical protein